MIYLKFFSKEWIVVGFYWITNWSKMQVFMGYLIDQMSLLGSIGKKVYSLKIKTRLCLYLKKDSTL